MPSDAAGGAALHHLGGLRLHHLGIVVGDIDAAVARYEALGFTGGERWEIPEQRVVAVTFLAGPGWVELIQPTDPDGPIARFHAKRGDGMHHIAYAVPDIAAALQRLAAAGVRLIDETPRTGTHGWRIAFIHPESCNGVLTELVQEGNEHSALALANRQVRCHPASPVILSLSKDLERGGAAGCDGGGENGAAFSHATSSVDNASF